MAAASLVTDPLSQAVGEWLIQQGKLTPEQWREAIASTARVNGGKQWTEALVELGYCSEDDVLHALSAVLQLPLVNLREEPIDPDALALVPAEMAFRHQVLPLRKENGVLIVAVADPLNVEAESLLRFVTGLSVRIVLAKPSEVRTQLEQHYMRRVIAEAETEDIEVIREAEEDIGDPTRLAREALVIRLVNMLIRNAVRERASDIHIEPLERELRVRYRVDGVLHEVPAPAKRLHPAIVSRIKIMANLDITERRKPQDGRIKVRILGREVDIRVSILPTVFGESVVMRLLDKAAMNFTLKDLGMLPDDLAKFEGLIKIPYGIILATGPTGSGKTTTLHAALKRIYSPERKIITIEDPVEYQLEGVTQIQVNPAVGLTFATGLRSILRHDPDVVMVGEIRDHETAEIAIHSALTGHLVFSTLHTNDAPGAITRLIEMGIEPFLVASSVEGVLAQRLVRRICQRCKEPYRPSDAVWEYLVAQGFVQSDEPVLWRGRGCPECRFSGYSGRTGIFEVLVMDDDLRDLVLRKASSHEIRQAAMEKGMRTLYQDGMLKTALGITTVEEVERVTHAAEAD
ncbi:Type II secretion system protein E [bacterium HR17]|jgi:type II secretion system protein E|uniref:protein-secreting ATPase n=1 Tax=Candidatus Fervidibacter japonicus TaxID=2035412 RepID=A0A2H5X9I7_9BACT|nr:Type II secretion system protein E [bacterium HR17]